MAIQLTKDNFDSVAASHGTLLIDFWAEWCEPCRQLSPILEDTVSSHSDITLCKVNADAEPELFIGFNIKLLPTLVLFRDGCELRRTAGLQTKEELLSFISV